jgi:hypothetical protein
MKKVQQMAQFSIRVTPEVNEKINLWTKKLGISKSALVQMCISAGMGSIIRAIAPEEVMTPEMWARIVQEVQKNEANSAKTE